MAKRRTDAVPWKPTNTQTLIPRRNHVTPIRRKRRIVASRVLSDTQEYDPAQSPTATLESADCVQTTGSIVEEPGDSQGIGGLHYYQYAFAASNCPVREIGSGIDPRFDVELICDGPIGAVVSRIGLDQFSQEKLQGKTTDNIRQLQSVAMRHNEVLCHIARCCAVLPLRMGTVFRSRDSLEAVLRRCQSKVVAFLEQLGNQQEWNIRLHLGSPSLEATPAHARPPSPHYAVSLASNRTGVRPGHGQPQIGEPSTIVSVQVPANDGAVREATDQKNRQLQLAVQQTIATVQRQLIDKAEHCCRIRTLPGGLVRPHQRTVFNAAFLLSADSRQDWLNTVHEVGQCVQEQGFLLEVSGPWPPYHFCPTLDL